MNDMQKITEYTQFIREHENRPMRKGGNKKMKRISPHWVQKRSGSRKEMVKASSMLIKCGVCTAACAAVLLMKWADIPSTEAALSTLKTTLNEEGQMDDMIGRLHFVELPGMIQVFSNAGKMELPVSATNIKLFEDGTILSMTLDGENTVKASLSGSIKETGIDNTLGKYVRICGENDTDLFIYGLTDVWVEVGQPISINDDIGSTNPASAIYLTMTICGRPQSLEDHFVLPETLL